MHVEYGVDLMLFAWPEDSVWSGYLLHHFDNGSFRDRDAILDLLDAWAELAHNRRLPWPGKPTSVDVLGMVYARNRGRDGEHLPLVVYTPGIIHTGFFGSEPSADRTAVTHRLERFEADPDSFVPNDDWLWNAFDGIANKVHAYSGWPLVNAGQRHRSGFLRRSRHR